MGNDATTSVSNSTICPKCSTAVTSTAKFCPNCGHNLQLSVLRPALTRSPVLLAGAVVVSLALAYGVVALQPGLIGTAPKPAAPAEVAAERSTIMERADPEVLQAQARLAQDPKNPEAIRSYVAVLLDRVQSPNVSPELIFELIEALGALIEADPNDKNALLSLADLSFNQRAFDQSAKYYERYLKLVPDDLKTKARYASSIQFLGRVAESEKILKEIIEKDPKHFEALAYLSIAYAQEGKNEESIRIGEQALATAPEKEAEVRFRAFLDELRKKKASGGAPASAQRSIGESPNSSEAAVAEHLRTNQIAGDKFVSTKLENGTLIIYMRNFPMSGMPAFVKEKFVSGVTGKIADPAINAVRFVEAETGATMHEVGLSRGESLSR